MWASTEGEKRLVLMKEGDEDGHGGDLERGRDRDCEVDWEDGCDLKRRWGFGELVIGGGE